MIGLNWALIGEAALALLVLSFYFYYPPICTALLGEFMPPLYTLCDEGFVWAFTIIAASLWIVRIANKFHTGRWP